MCKEVHGLANTYCTFNGNLFLMLSAFLLAMGMLYIY